MISKQALEEFKEIWADEVSANIDASEVSKASVALLTLFDAIYKPVRRDIYEQ